MIEKPRQTRKRRKGSVEGDADAFHRQHLDALPAFARVAGAPIVGDVQDMADRIESLEGERDALAEQNAKYADEVSVLEPMRLEYERGGFREIIAGFVEQIRALKTRVELESQEKVKNLRAMQFWKKKAIEQGYSSNEVIDLEEV